MSNKQIITMLQSTNKPRQLNLLCIGELQAGKSCFLERYTRSTASEYHYKIFVKEICKSTTIFFHEIEQKQGQEVYLTYPYDGVLFFINAVSFHNTDRAIMEYLNTFSQCSGINVNKIPIMAIVVAHQESGLYECISEEEKNKLLNEIRSVLPPEQVIYVQDGDDSQNKLARFYQAILEEQPMGIKESMYTQWYMKGALFFVPMQQIQLQLLKIIEEIKHTYLLKLALLKRFVRPKQTSSKSQLTNQ